MINAKTILFLFLFVFAISNNSYANAAQPGVWNAGGTVFTMLYPEDSLSFKKVQMEQEQIYIQLYKGYAVVKGVYLFKNTTNESLQFKMGYPVNGIYSGGVNDLNEISLDSLSQFKIKAKNNWKALVNEKHPELNNTYNKTQAFSDNWKVWDMAFAPNETQAVTVYFIVNTNDAQIRKGYSVNHKNAFIYLLESGSVWHQPVEKGNFYVQLMDGLQAEDVAGISSGFDFKFNDDNQLYSGNKYNFLPTAKDNLVITYHETNQQFLFKEVIPKTSQLFASIDELSNLSIGPIEFTAIEIGDPYAVKTSFWASLTNLLLLLVIYAPYLVGFIILLFLIWFIFKRRKIKNNTIN